MYLQRHVRIVIWPGGMSRIKNPRGLVHKLRAYTYIVMYKKAYTCIYKGDHCYSIYMYPVKEPAGASVPERLPERRVKYVLYKLFGFMCLSRAGCTHVPTESVVAKIVFFRSVIV